VDWVTIDNLPVGSTFDYLLEPPPGSYGYLVVAWIEEGRSIFLFDSWVELAFHPDQTDPQQPGEVVVIGGEMVTIDLVADLSLVPQPRTLSDLPAMSPPGIPAAAAAPLPDGHLKERRR
jgi:hypothetical protein